MEKIKLSNIKIFGEPDIQYRRFPKNASAKQILDIIKKPFITTSKIILSFSRKIKKIRSTKFYYNINL